MVEYVQDIHSYYKRVEPKYKVAADYMKKQVGGTVSPGGRGPGSTSHLLPSPPHLQPDINEKMRGILIDWLVEVHLKFKVPS